LLAASPVVLETETGSRVRDSLLSMLRGIHPDLASALTSPGSKATKVSNPETAKTAEADRDTLSAPVALQADEASTGTRPEGSTTTTDLPEQAPETSPPSLPADHALTANKPVVTTLPPAPIDIQAELSGSGLQVERLADDRLKVNLNNVGMFEFNSTRLSASADEALTELAGILEKHDGIHIDVIGHTDSSGEPDYNVYLSQLRAKAVEDHLVRMGLPEESVRSEGRGDRDTRFETATQDNPELRRRVEIYIRMQQ
jgi:outer membrane protein OmpA-like peptidoglycan-associated protein